jgi:hypothetical protein
MIREDGCLANLPIFILVNWLVMKMRVKAELRDKY